MTIKAKISTQFTKFSRVWKLMKKPSMREFKLIAKVTAVGLLLIGAIGFLINIAMSFFF